MNQDYAEWPRARYKGEWCTNPEDVPKNYKDFSEWNNAYFIRKASTVGSNTTELIKRILKSWKLEVQTYRLCMGVLGFTKKYSRAAQEECCKRALAAERATYTYVMDSSYSDIDKLLNRSRVLADHSGKGAQ